MATGFGRSGLPLGYRIGYRFKHAGLTVFGPAQLGEGNDPKLRLERERERRITAAREARAARKRRATDGPGVGRDT